MNAKSSNKIINIILILLFFLSVSSIAYLSFPQKNAGSSIQNSKKDLTFQTLDNQEISSFNLMYISLIVIYVFFIFKLADVF